MTFNAALCCCGPSFTLDSFFVRVFPVAFFSTANKSIANSVITCDMETKEQLGFLRCHFQSLSSTLIANIRLSVGKDLDLFRAFRFNRACILAI